MRAVKPTRQQKELIKKTNLNYNNWLVVKDYKGVLTIRHKDAGRERRIEYGNT